MEPPSGRPCSRRVPWQGLLLIASLLTSWNPPTTAQLTVESVPSSAAEGTDVLLLVHSLTESPLSYYWHKGDRVASTNRILLYVVATGAITPGPAHSGRETIYPNGSLLLQNVTQNDTGYYTIQVLSQTLQSEEATGQFHVAKDNSPGLPVGAIAGIVTGVLAGVTLATVVCVVFLTGIGRASGRCDLREQRPGKSVVSAPSVWVWLDPEACPYNVRSCQTPPSCPLRQLHLFGQDQPHPGQELGLSSGPGPPHPVLTHCKETPGIQQMQGGFSEHQSGSRVNQDPSPPPDPRATNPVYEELLHPDANMYCRINHRPDVAP
ncbi:carcinoembryonic antigen-related cell adhesion molecule 3-like [Nycticebus coucang]|uniref:carcinoembryonic antigen-related cell adhesion molecule 3-like n=1 Tax=Nycticebus coucang TaxID=9470 RepID=UPI00234E0C68|nr:carcinoembryonic antigen-related cell adhesion molecule 3-like [Nycticebus coucang]